MTDKKIDPRFYIPPVENYVYRDATMVDSDDGSAAEELELVGVGAGSGLQPPSEMTIVEQIVRKGPDGRTVVDLIVEVEDMPGATEYELRTAIV